MLADAMQSFWEANDLNGLSIGWENGVSPPMGAELINFPFPDLPGWCCAAAGGDLELVRPLAAACSAFYLAARYLDDLADAQTPDASSGVLVTRAVALLLSGALTLLDDLPASPEIACQIQREFYQAALHACAGQLADLQERRPSLKTCWRIAEAKSGAVYRLICRSSARLACADEARLHAFGEFGMSLGVILQIADDLSDLRGRPGNPSDLACGKWSLPVAYAMQVAPPPRRAELLECLAAARHDQEAEERVRAMLVEMGAVLYLAAQSERLRQQAEAALLYAAPPGTPRQMLLTILSETIPARLHLPPEPLPAVAT